MSKIDPNFTNIQSIGDNRPFVVSTKLFRLLESYKNKQFLVIEPGGNFGDTLIYKGGEKLLKSLNINFKTYSFNSFLLENPIQQETVIYIHGGGAINEWYGNRPLKLLSQCIKQGYEDIILGPFSCGSNTNYLRKIFTDLKNNTNFQNKRIYFFAREAVSYELLKEYLPASINLDLDHDTALNLCESDFRCSKKEDYVLFTLREDVEKGKKIDLSIYGLYLDPAIFCQSFEEWIDIHTRAEIIITNRVHSSIISSILHKQVFLFSNIYHKNKAIWEYSLYDRQVQWLEMDDKITNHIKLYKDQICAFRLLFFINAIFKGISFFGMRYVVYFYKMIILNISRAIAGFKYKLKSLIKYLLFNSSHV